MLGGLPAFSEYVIRISTVARGRPCGSLALVVYHLLGDMANAAELALSHYFPLEGPGKSPAQKQTDITFRLALIARLLGLPIEVV